jgi:hypothetical protein
MKRQLMATYQYLQLKLRVNKLNIVEGGGISTHFLMIFAQDIHNYIDDMSEKLFA